MNKLVIIGDTHARIIWKEIIAVNKDADLFIFMGDYFDTFDKTSTGHDQLQNFEEILAQKKAEPEKFILLFGNHELHYIINEAYSGYQAGYADTFYTVIKEAIITKDIQMCYIYKDVIFTHAGISKTWYDNYFEGADNVHTDIYSAEIIQRNLNDCLLYVPTLFKFDSWEEYGDSATSSPVWLRPNALNKHKLKGYTYVVGHTSVNKVAQIQHKIWGVDALEYRQYLVIENGEFIPKTI